MRNILDKSWRVIAMSLPIIFATTTNACVYGPLNMTEAYDNASAVLWVRVTSAGSEMDLQYLIVDTLKTIKGTPVGKKLVTTGPQSCGVGLIFKYLKPGDDYVFFISKVSNQKNYVSIGAQPHLSEKAGIRLYRSDELRKHFHLSVENKRNI